MNGNRKKTYKILPYAIGLLITVIVIVLFSYFAQERNSKQEASGSEPQQYTQQAENTAENNEK